MTAGYSSGIAALAAQASHGAPDPEDAARRCERVLAAAGGDPGALGVDARTILMVACRRAPYLATLLARDGRRLARVACDPYLRRQKPAAVIAAEVRVATAGVDDAVELAALLRRCRGDELVRLGVRELELGLATEVGAELAHLADAAFDAAIGFHSRALAARHGPARCIGDDGVERDAELVVIGMGKLGGEELNFSSDVDVIYVYSSDQGGAGARSLHEHFAELCRLVTASIGEVTEDDTVFRVDLRLRPEGSRGAIANALASTERYYESFGRPWERQAWLKARPCAGSRRLGEEVMATLRPFIYPRITSPTVVADVAALNRRIKAELDDVGPMGGFDVKNGVGGIREVEFFVQALQMIHGGRREALRSRTTLVALDQLMFAGLIHERERRALAAAYRWLRHVEHVLQLESGRQTQRLPAERGAIERVARRLGLADADALLATLAAHTAEVSRLFATLGAPEDGPPAAVLALLDPDGGRDGGGDVGDSRRERELRLLARLGFHDPSASLHELEVARRKPLSVFGPAARGAEQRVAPALLAEITRSPDPDQALRYVSDLISRRSNWSVIWRLFDEHPAIMRSLVALLGTSDYLGKRFVGDPGLVDTLFELANRTAPPPRAELAARLDARLAAVDASDEGERWNLLAAEKNAEVLRIGLADVGGLLSPMAVCASLSQLADLVLERAFALVVLALRERHGVPRGDDGAEATMAVLGLGKLGGEELGYAADLDLVFVYSADGDTDGERSISNVEYMTRLAQRLMSGLHVQHERGRLYEVDTRLRPSGSRGLLVSSLSAWRRYHQDEARLWERQALIKLRPVAGDARLGGEVAAAAEAFVWGGAAVDPAAVAREVTAMRDRIEHELASGSDLKAGRGGLIDVEFAAQALQLAGGGAHRELRTRQTVAALEAAARLGLADAGDCALLIDGYRFLRQLEHRMRIVHDRSVHRLPEAAHDLELLARRVGFPDGVTLRGSFERWTGEIRAAYQRVLGHLDPSTTDG